MYKTGTIQEKADVSDTFSVYSFEFDSSKHKYTTGANQVGKNLDALGEDLMEEENIDEDLDNNSPTVIAPPPEAPSDLPPAQTTPQPQKPKSPEVS